MAETATLTVLFTDIVGSTALYDRHGADATDELRRAQFAALRACIAANNGTEVKSTGDGLMVAFSSAADAVACGVAMQQALGVARRADPRLPATRVGISAGEATREDNDWYGPPVVEAARLCQEADGDQILASAVIAMLVGSRGGHEFVDLGPRSLKGFNQPIAVREVRWQPAAVGGVPLPYAVVNALAGPYVGRAEVADRLDAAWRRASARGGMALVAGEPGIGKTRAVAEMARAVHEEGGVVLWGRCDEDLAVPFQPFVEALRNYINEVDVDQLRGLEPAPDLLRLVPDLKDRLPDIEPPKLAGPDVERILMFDAALDFLGAVARCAPVLLILDDVHWATTPTLLLLRYLLRPDRRPEGVLVVATYRDTELARAHPLADTLAELRSLADVERIALDGLTTDDVAALVTATGGEAAMVASAVYEETEGNPFFVGEVLRHLVDNDWNAGTGGIPEGVREVIGRRMSRLSEAANKVLAVAAAIGPEVDLALLEAIPDAADAGPVLDALEEAARARLMTELPSPVGRFAFTHALVRHTLYAELSVARRARLHRRIGQALAALGDEPDSSRLAALARHFVAGATSGEIDAAIEWSTRAADDSMLRGAPEEAVSHYSAALQVLELADEPDERVQLRLLMALSAALQFAGDVIECRDRALDVARLARKLGDPVALAHASVVRTGWGLAGTRDDEGEALLVEALAALGDEHPVIRADLQGLLAFYQAVYLGQGWEVDDLARDAVTLARSSGSSAALGYALNQRAIVLQGSPDVAEQERVVAELARVGAHIDDTVRDWVSLAPLRDMISFSHDRNAPIIALQRGDIARFDSGLAEIEVRARQPAAWIAQAIHHMWGAMRALMDGDPDRAESHANRIIETTADTNFFNSWAGQIFAVNRARGTLGDVRQLFVDAAAATPGIVALRCLVALAAADIGDHDEARGLVQVLLADPATTLRGNSILPAVLAHLTNTVTTIGETVGTDSLIRALEPYSGQLLVVAWGVTCEGAADRYLGMLRALTGDLSGAAAAFDRALVLERHVGCSALVAETERWRTRLLS